MSALSAVGAPTIGFAGLTHLGLCSAVTAASKGFQVVGYDSDRIIEPNDLTDAFYC